MRYDLVIFDLDGTLLDTVEDLAAAVNHALAKRALPARSLEDVRRFIGDGVANLIRRAVPEGTDPTLCADVLADFRRYYFQHVDVHTHPYPGIDALLDDLAAAGIVAAVNSNKVDEAVNALIRAHFGPRVALALGERPDTPKKPAPDGVYAILDALGVTGDRALYVGDGEADLLTAKNAGVDCAWVSWGYRRAEELAEMEIPHRFDSVAALRDFILAPSPVPSQNGPGSPSL